jgi:hypothetical protein
MIRRPTRLRAGSAALRQHLRLVVAGDARAAIGDPGAALGDGAVKCHEFRIEVAARLRRRHEMVMAILAVHEGGAVLAGELRHVSRDIAWPSRCTGRSTGRFKSLPSRRRGTACSQATSSASNFQRWLDDTRAYAGTPIALAALSWRHHQARSFRLQSFGFGPMRLPPRRPRTGLGQDWNPVAAMPAAGAGTRSAPGASNPRPVSARPA